jgi:hypothetical protein
MYLELPIIPIAQNNSYTIFMMYLIVITDIDVYIILFCYYKKYYNDNTLDAIDCSQRKLIPSYDLELFINIHPICLGIDINTDIMYLQNIFISYNLNIYSCFYNCILLFYSSFFIIKKIL